MSDTAKPLSPKGRLMEFLTFNVEDISAGEPEDVAIATIRDLQAEIKRLNDWCDGFSDQNLKERATAGEYQKELQVENERLGQHVKDIFKINETLLAERKQLRERAEKAEDKLEICGYIGRRGA